MKTSRNNKYAIEIRVIRARLGLTQSEFAKSLGLTQRTISLYENGQSTPNVRIWDRIKNMVETDA